MKSFAIPTTQLSADTVRLRPDNSVGNFVLYALFALMVLIVTLTALISTQQSRYTDDLYDFSQILTGVVAVLFAIQVRRQVGHLALMARVLRNRQAPHRIWRDNVRGILVELIRHTTVATGILVTGFLFPYSPWQCLVPAVVIAIVCSMTLGLSLLHYGFFSAGKYTWISGILFALIAAAIFKQGVPLLMVQINQLSVMALFGLSLIWPLSLMAVYQAFNIRIPTCREVVVVQLWNELTKRIQRYSAVENMMGTQFKKGAVASISSLITGALQLGLFLPNIFVEAQRPVRTPYSLYVFTVYSLVLASFLIVKDVHWRYFLQPGKRQVRLFANNILRSSIEVQLSLLVATIVIYQAVALLVDHDHLFKFLGSLPQYWLFPFEWLFANVFAIYLASFNKPNKLSVAQVVMLMIAISITVYFGIHFKDAQLFHAGPIYAGCLLVLSYLLMRVNNRRWSSELALMRVKN